MLENWLARIYSFSKATVFLIYILNCFALFKIAVPLILTEMFFWVKKLSCIQTSKYATSVMKKFRVWITEYLLIEYTDYGSYNSVTYCPRG